MMRAGAEALAILKHNGGIVGIADFAGALDDGLENRHYIRR